MKQYRLDNYGEEEYSLNHLLEIMEDRLKLYEEETFVNEFDELYPVVSIAGHTYKASKVLKEMNYDAYSCEFEIWINRKIEQLEKELEPLKHGSWINFMRNVIEVRIK